MSAARGRFAERDPALPGGLSERHGRTARKPPSALPTLVLEEAFPSPARWSSYTPLLELGVPPQVVRGIVGHSDIQVTMTIYAHASLDEKRRALTQLDDRLA
ncbi:MAG: hypothetical protein QOJ32_1237 [Frankiaceae bacterium]|jgi:integrase|nr:hypothetical protein [Frankiaceae bacterium]